MHIQPSEIQISAVSKLQVALQYLAYVVVCTSIPSVYNFGVPSMLLLLNTTLCTFCVAVRSSGLPEIGPLVTPGLLLRLFKRY